MNAQQKQTSECSVTRTYVLIVLVILFFKPAPAAAASGDNYWDNRFIAGGTVISMISHGGNLYVAGTIHYIGAVDAVGIAKWDGTNWTGLGLAEPSAVYALAASAKNIYAAGDLYLSDGAAGIARWDGTNWTRLTDALPVNARVIAVSDDDANLYVGLSNPGSFSYDTIMKFESGVLVPLGGGIPATTSLAEPISALAIHGSNLYVGGEFYAAGTNNVAVSNIAVWNGANWSDVGGGVDWRKPEEGVGYVARTLAFCKGKLYVGGLINRTGGSPTVNAQNIVSWDGTNWSDLNGGVNFPVHAIATDGDDVYVAGGTDSNLNCPVMKWDGISWSNLGSGILASNSGCPAVYALARQGADLFVGGDFENEHAPGVTNLSIWHIPVALESRRGAGGLEISWRGDAFDYVLESSQEVPSTNWVAVPAAKTPTGRYAVTNDFTGPMRFVRLRHR